MELADHPMNTGTIVVQFTREEAHQVIDAVLAYTYTEESISACDKLEAALYPRKENSNETG